MERVLVLGIVTVAVLRTGCGGPSGAPERKMNSWQKAPAEPVENGSSATFGAKSLDVLPGVKSQPIGSMTASDGNNATELCVYV